MLSKFNYKFTKNLNYHFVFSFDFRGELIEL